MFAFKSGNPGYLPIPHHPVTVRRIPLTVHRISLTVCRISSIGLVDSERRRNPTVDRNDGPGEVTAGAAGEVHDRADHVVGSTDTP